MAGDDYKPIVYVSYSQEKEKQNGMLSQIQDNLPDVILKIDKESINYRQDFMEFIEEIGKAEFILILFSQSYFESYYCMYELTRIMQHGGNLTDRVFLVRDETFPLNEENNKKTIRDYWQEMVDLGDNAFRPEHLNACGEKKEIIEIHRQLGQVFKQFATVHAPNERKLFPEVSYADLQGLAAKPIRDWLKEVLPPSPLSGRTPDGDKTFCVDVQDEIESILEQHPSLFDCISKRLGENKEAEDLADKLCNYENQRELISPHLNKACRKAVQQVKRLQSNEDVDDLKSNIRNMICWLSVLAIKPDWVEKEKDNRGSILNLPVQTSFGEASTAGRIGQVKPDLVLENKQTNTIRGKHEINPFKVGTWSNKNNLAVNAVMRFIFNQVFGKNPEMAIKETDTLTEKERKELNTQIKLNAEDGTRHYYCMLRPKETDKHFLDNPELIQQLKTYLPAFDIFRVQDTVGNVVFVAADEIELSQTYHHFLTQLEKW